MSTPVRRQIISTKPSPAAVARRKYVAIGSLVLLAIVIIVAISLANRVTDSASTAPVVSTIKVGDKAPDFTVSSTGGPFQLSTSGATKPTLLEVFATWCPHCQREAPLLSTLYDQYKSRVNFIGVAGSANAIDGSSPETQVDVVDWAQKFDARYPVAFDPDLSVAKAYLQGGFPTVVLIDHGVVQSLRSGEMPTSDIAAGLNALLAGKKPDPKLGMKGQG
jgi:thiol-disulfide isomerase/thioredoxin